VLLAALRTLGAAPARSLMALAQRLGVAEADAATVVVPLQEASAPGSPIPAAAPASPLVPMTGRNDASSAPKTLLHRKKPWYPDLDVKELPEAASSPTSPCSRKPARGPRFPIHPPGRHPGVERGLERRDQLLKLIERQAGHIQKLCGAILHVGEP
jgi:hypothetical protein